MQKDIFFFLLLFYWVIPKVCLYRSRVLKYFLRFYFFNHNNLSSFFTIWLFCSFYTTTTKILILIVCICINSEFSINRHTTHHNSTMCTFSPCSFHIRSTYNSPSFYISLQKSPYLVSHAVHRSLQLVGKRKPLPLKLCSSLRKMNYSVQLYDQRTLSRWWRGITLYWTDRNDSHYFLYVLLKKKKIANTAVLPLALRQLC